MKVLILNLYFPPDRAATGILLGQLAEDLSKEFDVTVVCGAPTYAPETTAVRKSERLRVIRIPLIRASRSNLFVRIANYVIFMVGARVRTFLLPRHDVVICWTDPPVVGMLGVGTKYVKGSKFVFVSQDVYPEVAIAMKRMSNPISRGILHLASRLILRTADAVVAVGDDMRERLIRKRCRPEKLHVIPNWQDLEGLKPTDGTAFRRRNGVSDQTFVVMHSGNIGFSQDFDALLEAAALTKNDPDIIYFIIGDGGREKEVRSKVQSRALGNVRILPYQPSGQLAESLSSGDLHYVSLLPELTGTIVPSKMYGILAVGRPILSNVAAGCEVERILREAHCGIVADGNPQNLAQKIREAKTRRDELQRMGENGRRWIEQNGGRPRAAAAYGDLLRKVTRP